MLFLLNIRNAVVSLALNLSKYCPKGSGEAAKWVGVVEGVVAGCNNLGWCSSIEAPLPTPGAEERQI
jgi:hypothetical protein